MSGSVGGGEQFGCDKGVEMEGTVCVAGCGDIIVGVEMILVVG